LKTPGPVTAASTGETVPDRVHFALNRDIISARSAAILQRVAAVMKADPAIRVELNGHADERGHRIFNLVLSRQRAEVVRTYLVASGIERGRIHVSAAGSGSPVKQGNDIVSYARNRRVEIVFSGAERLRVMPQLEDLQLEKVHP
jgi:outer membrane protein OmpA-like peptidoglycan-associated protein